MSVTTKPHTFSNIPAMPAPPTTSATPTAPIATTSSVSIAAGTTIYFDGSSGFNNGRNGYNLSSIGFDLCPSLTNAGAIYAINNVTPTAIYEDFSFQNFSVPRAVISNLATGSIIAYATGDSAATAFYTSSFGSLYGSDFNNAGLVEAVSQQGVAKGITSADPNFAFTNSGTVTVWANHEAFGVAGDNGIAFSNTGTIDVTGGTPLYPLADFSAIAVYNPKTFNNSGTIRATSGGALPSAAVQYGSHNADYVNTGTIIGDYAFVDPSYDLNRPFGQGTLTNSGSITGDILPAPPTIHNTGTITGDIRFTVGNSVYDGANGHLNGTIYLGHGNNTVTLGAENGVVYGGGGSDTITGGAGNDFFDITRGTNTIDGKGGTNTLALASSDMGYTVDLGAGTVTGPGTTTIANIQQVIGTSFNDTLKAGAVAATLVGGRGSDTLIGGAANDTLVAGPGGGDTMTGGGGSDNFIYSSGDAQLVITDFGADLLKIYGYSAASSVVQQGSDTLITLSGSDSVLLKNVLASSLTPSNVLYNATPYSGPSLPPSQPVFGKDPIQFSYDLTIYKGESLNLAVGESNYITEPSGSSVVTGLYRNGFGSAATLDNFGAINVSGNDQYGVTGFVWDNSNSTGGFTNEAGATFTASNQGGDAHGVNVATVGGWPSQVLNAGTLTVTSGSGGIFNYATGIDAGTNTKVINASGGLLSVTAPSSGAYGVNFSQGGAVENNGTITVSATAPGQSAWGFYFARAMLGPTVNAHGTASTVLNTGTLTVAAAHVNGANSYGIVFSGGSSPQLVPSITNTGTITAGVAISVEYNTSAAITNSGTINGEIDLNGIASTLTNSGTINGNIVLKSLTGGSTGQTIDLRNGVFHGSITIAPTFDASTSEHDVILLGANGTTVSVAGGLPNLIVDITGGAGNDTLTDGSGADRLSGGGGNDTLDGGANVDTAVFAGNKSAYTVTQTSTGNFTISGPDGTDTLTNIEYAKFDDQTIRLLPGTGSTVNFAADPSTYMGAIRDFDGNDLGGAASWKLIGTADVNGDGLAEHILFNKQIGRWAEVGSEADGKTYFANNGWAGDTRVVGIYIDPLVANGTVVKNSDTDSQRRFQNDLQIDNIKSILGQGDYNHDGLQEIYFSLTDGTAYLHAYMHADGNIQYANYQNKQQVIDYLTSNGVSSSTWASWFPAGQSVMAAVAG